jgi:hypothetical protein
MADQKPTIPPIPQLDLFAEIWRSVVGFEGRYEVSNHGHVRSVDRVITDLNGKVYRRKGTLLRPGNQGPRRGQHYQHVVLLLNGKEQHKKVHHLVLEAFIGPRPPGYECNHRDGHGENNRVDNLEWVTRRANIQHAVDMGLLKPPRGAQHAMAKLMESDIPHIRRLGMQRIKISIIAQRFGISSDNVRLILRRKTWRHLPEDEE